MKGKKSERYTRGWEKLSEITGESGRKTIKRWEEFFPDMCDYIVEFAYGDVYSRPGLDLRQRMTVTLTALITLGGCEKEMAVHIGSALNVGLTSAEVVEIVLHCAPYVGFPRVTGAMSVVRSVFEERGIPFPSGPSESA